VTKSEMERLEDGVIWDKDKERYFRLNIESGRLILETSNEGSTVWESVGEVENTRHLKRRKQEQ